MAATIPLADSDTFTGGGATHTYTLDIGVLGSVNDVLVLGAAARSISGMSAVSSVTVAGKSATQVVVAFQDEGGGIKTMAGIWTIRRGNLDNPSATSVSVSVVLNTSTLRGAASIYVLAGSQAAPFAVGDWGDLDSPPIDVSLNVPVAGAAVGCVYHGDGDTFTWSGLVEDVDVALPGPNSFGSASVSNSVGATPLLVQVTIAGSSLAGVAVSASFSEAPPPGPEESEEAIALNIKRGGPKQVPAVGASWTPSDPFDPDVDDAAPTRATIQPGVNSPRIKGIGWRREIWRLRLARGRY